MSHTIHSGPNKGTTHHTTGPLGVPEPVRFSWKGRDIGGMCPPDREMVEEVAIRMCLGMGLNPFERVSMPLHDTEFYPPPLPVGQKIVISINGVSSSSPMSEFMQVPPMTSAMRWEGFVRKAAEAIAGWNAVHAAVLGDRP